MTYPYNLFIIKDNISYKKLEQMSNIFETISRVTPKSLLDIFKIDIDNNFKTNYIAESDKFQILNNISIEFENILLNNKNIQDFFKYLVDFKNTIILNNSYIDTFLSILNNKDIYIYNNPINSNSIEKNFLNNSILDNIYKKYSSTFNNEYEIEQILDILLYGDIINLKLPSIGAINSKFSNNNNNFIIFIQHLINNKDIKNTLLKNKLPILSLHLGDKLSNILLNLTNNNNLKYDNTIKNLLSNMINNINIDLEEIYYLNKKIRNEYIIPYHINKIGEIEESNKSIIDKIKDYKSLFKSNNDLIIYIIEDINIDINNIEKKNYKNVLACYLFYIINICYKILYLYIDNIDNILKNFLNTKDKRFKSLNIEDAFDYTQLIKESLLKFKLIMLNNFYYLFLPSNISDGNYGMKLNSNKCFIPESTFMNSNIYDSYPFNNVISDNIIVNSNKLTLFLTTIHDKKDIYNKLDLEFGGLAFDQYDLKNAIKILKEYFIKLQKNNKFNLFIINKIIYNFNVNKSIPYNLINELEPEIKDLIKSSSLNSNNKNKLERIILNKYETNIEKAAKYYLKYIDIKNTIKLSKKVNIHNLYRLEELNYLYFNTYFIIANCIYIILEKDTKDNKLKNSILYKCNNIKKYYENKIQEYIII